MSLQNSYRTAQRALERTLAELQQARHAAHVDVTALQDPRIAREFTQAAILRRREDALATARKVASDLTPEALRNAGTAVAILRTRADRKAALRAARFSPDDGANALMKLAARQDAADVTDLELPGEMHAAAASGALAWLSTLVREAQRRSPDDPAQLAALRVAADRAVESVDLPETAEAAALLETFGNLGRTIEAVASSIASGKVEEPTAAEKSAAIRDLGSDAYFERIESDKATFKRDVEKRVAELLRDPTRHEPAAPIGLDPATAA